MKRASLIGLIASLGSVLGSGCGTPPASPQAPVLAPQYVDTHPSGSVTGFAWDPEAFYLSTRACNAAYPPACPFPPLMTEGIPLYTLSAVSGAVVFMLDPLDPPPDPPALPKLISAPSSETGVWSVQNMPVRDEVPFFAVSTGEGSLYAGPPSEATGGLPAIAPATYLPTMNLRPYFTGNFGACPMGEAIQTSDRGVLEAVAKYRQAHGAPTTVMNLLDPTKYAAVTVFWMYQPGPLPNLLTPANATTVMPSVGTRYHIGWKALDSKDTTQSRRGFYVEDKATSSSIGVTVVVVPASAITGDPTVTYTPEDTVVDAAQGRPFAFPPLPLPINPGLISAFSLQMAPSAIPPDGTPDPTIPGYICIQ